MSWPRLTVSSQVGERERAMPVTRHCTALQRGGSFVASSPIPVAMTLRGGAKGSANARQMVRAHPPLHAKRAPFAPLGLGLQLYASIVII